MKGLSIKIIELYNYFKLNKLLKFIKTNDVVKEARALCRIEEQDTSQHKHHRPKLMLKMM